MLGGPFAVFADLLRSSRIFASLRETTLNKTQFSRGDAKIRKASIRKDRKASMTVAYFSCPSADCSIFFAAVLMSLKFNTALNNMLNSPKFCHR